MEEQEGVERHQLTLETLPAALLEAVCFALATASAADAARAACTCRCLRDAVRAALARITSLHYDRIGERR